ncbi:MAG: HAD-IG family 5'-nucleotidase [Myxococcota bacterium]
MPVLPERPPRERGIFCNRTLNLRSIRAIGYDMDYTLLHYHVDVWEERAYAYVRDTLAADGWPVEGLRFEPEMVIRGLILDLELGNVVKANRFGYVKQSAHGTRVLPFDEQRAVYSRTVVDLAEPRWVFLNTLFSMSEATIYSQLVDKLDRRELPEVLGYPELYARVRQSMDAAHMEGRLKADIVADPARYVVGDPEVPLALLDQKEAGKKLLLITNSEWPYTRDMMAWAFDPHLPGDTTWRDLFDLKIVSARKPLFFQVDNPVFEVVDEEGLLAPVRRGLQDGGIYLGGSAKKLEDHLGLDGSQILYVGDHAYADVNVSKSVLRWRTALVLRELEDELSVLAGFEEDQRRLGADMERKADLELRQAELRLAMQRLERGYGPQPDASRDEIAAELDEVGGTLRSLDAGIAPLAARASSLANERWGLLMRAGNDKSHLARQVERYADIYLSRVSNFLYHTPYLYVRSPRSSLPHDDLR